MKTYLSLAQAIDTIAAATPDALALVDARSGAKTSYAALVAKTKSLATWLADRGVAEGDRVAIVAHNSPRILELLVACSRIGAILAPLNVRLSDPEIAAVVGIAEPKLLLVDDAHATRLQDSGVPRFAIEDDAPLAAPAIATSRTASAKTPLVLLFTSGTTGTPKGAMVTESVVHANAASTCEAWGLTANDVALVDAPMFHAGGLSVLATPLLSVGGTVVVSDRFDAQASTALLLAHGVTVAFGVPTMLERLLAEGAVDASKVRLWVTGGAPCTAAIFDAFAAKKVRLVQGFGMTECGPNCFRPEPSADPRSIGVPTHGLSARLVDEAGKDVAPGNPGELLLRGPHVFGGYFRNPDATRAAIDAEGWLHTGDMLRASPSGEGWFVVGRKKEMFISGGENVYPAEIERALLEHQGIAEAAVVSVPDPKWGEAGVAFVVMRASEPLDAAALRTFLRGRLAAYKVPRTFFAHEALPRTASGKIDRRRLSDAAQSTPAS